LDASGILFQRDDLTNLLRSVPTLERLALNLSKACESISDSSATSLVQLFHRHDASGRYDVLPKLRHLELEVDLKLYFDALFVAFETRCPQPYPFGGTTFAGVPPASGCALESAWVNIHAPVGHVAPAEWKLWLDSLHQRGLPVRLSVPFAKTPITFAPALPSAPASRLHMFTSLVDAL
jgi:hypothetical protein